jgi:hypothetical protein
VKTPMAVIFGGMKKPRSTGKSPGRAREQRWQHTSSFSARRFAFQPEFGQVANRGEVFTVIRQLPEADGGFQYQIKSEIDGHVRVVPESQIADL